MTEELKSIGTWYKHEDGSVTIDMVVVQVTERERKLSGEWTLEYTEDLEHVIAIDPRKFKNWANQLASARRKENKLKGRS